MFNCVKNERYYRPKLPEQLCTLGIIDADDTVNYSPQNPYSFIDNLRFISFEKSFQSEFPEEINDSLRNFSFSISSENKELIDYHSDSVIRNLKDFKLPLTEFRSKEKYYLKASEDGTSEISAEITVPDPPSSLILNSITKEAVAKTISTDCSWPFDDSLKLAIIDLSFTNNNLYYAVLVEANGSNFSFAPGILGFVDFTIMESNTQGFPAIIQGLKMRHLLCKNKRLTVNSEPDQVKAYIINGNYLSDRMCNITLLVNYNDGYSFYNVFTSFRIKLMSIPRELYMFEKSLYTYEKTSKDPFSEPVYLNGNIKNGNGIFAICRSTEISIILPFPPMF